MCCTVMSERLILEDEEDLTRRNRVYFSTMYLKGLFIDSRVRKLGL